MKPVMALEEPKSNDTIYARDDAGDFYPLAKVVGKVPEYTEDLPTVTIQKVEVKEQVTVPDVQRNGINRFLRQMSGGKLFKNFGDGVFQKTSVASEQSKLVVNKKKDELKDVIWNVINTASTIDTIVHGIPNALQHL